MKESLKQIIDTLTSPTKMALFAVVYTSCWGFLHGLLSEMQFVAIVTGVTGFYFGQHMPGTSSGGASKTSISSTSVTPAPEPPPTPEPTAVPPAGEPKP